MSILQYDNYREAIRDLIKARPKKGRGEIANISNYLGVAPTLVSQILSGNRELSLEQAIQIAEYFQLSDVERDLFITQVLKERSGTPTLQKYWFEKLTKLKEESQTVKVKFKAQKELSDEAKSIFYSSYLYSAIRIYCSLKEGKNLQEICKKFDLARERALEIIAFLSKHKLLIESRGIYSLGLQNVHVSKGSPYVSMHHRNWRSKGVEYIEDANKTDLFFTCPCSLDEEAYAKLKESVLNLIEETGNRVRASDPEKFVCLNIDLFQIDN